MRQPEALTWVSPDEVKRAARRIGPRPLQQYLDDLTRTRAYGWWEARTPTDAERSRLAEFIDDEQLDHYKQFRAEPTHVKVDPLSGDELHEYLSAVNLAALVKTTPFVQWCNEERQRLWRDFQLLANWAEQCVVIAEAALKRARAAYVAWQSYTSNGELPDWQEAQLRMAQYSPVRRLYSVAAAARREAFRASRVAAGARSAVDRLNGVKSCDLALLGAALESFICEEFTHALSSVDSVAMLFFVWVDAASIFCANPRCSQQILRTSARRRRPQEYCSPACKMVAYRARRESVQVA